MEENNETDSEKFSNTLTHNGLLYDCHLGPVKFKQTEDLGYINVSIPAEQVTSELYEIVRGGEYIVNINTADTRYEIDSARVDYLRRGDSMTFNFNDEIYLFDCYARD